MDPLDNSVTNTPVQKLTEEDHQRKASGRRGSLPQGPSPFIISTNELPARNEKPTSFDLSDTIDATLIPNSFDRENTESTLTPVDTTDNENPQKKGSGRRGSLPQARPSFLNSVIGKKVSLNKIHSKGYANEDIENSFNKEDRLLVEARKVERYIKAVEILYLLSFAVLGGFICYNLYDTYVKSERGTTFRTSVSSAQSFPQILFGPGSNLVDIAEPLLCTWAPDNRATNEMWVEVQSRYQGVSDATDEISSTGFRKCATVSLQGTSKYHRLSENIIAGSKNHQLMLYIGAQQSERLRGLINASGPKRFGFNNDGSINALPGSYQGNDPYIPNPVANTLPTGFFQPGENKTFEGTAPTGFQGSQGFLPFVQNTNSNGLPQSIGNSPTSAEPSESTPTDSLPSAPTPSSAPSSASSSASSSAPSQTNGSTASAPAIPSQSTQNFTPLSVPVSPPSAPTSNGRPRSPSASSQNGAPPTGSSQIPENSSTPEQQPPSGRKLLLTSNEVDAPLPEIGNFTTYDGSADFKFVEEPWSSDHIIMYIIPTHGGPIDTTEAFTNAISANQISINGGKMTHTFLQMLKAEQYYLSGNIIDSYQVHSSAVDLSFDPMSATGYRKYLQKQLRFTSDEWNTILGFNTSEALVSEIQLMIRSKLRVVNNTDSIFSVSYQSMQVNQLFQTKKMSWEEMVGGIGGWLSILWGASLHLILFHRGNGLLIYVVTAFLAAADVATGKVLDNENKGFLKSTSMRRREISIVMHDKSKSHE